MDMVVAKASAQWFCYLSIQHNVRLVPVERLAPIDLPQLASTDGDWDDLRSCFFLQHRIFWVAFLGAFSHGCWRKNERPPLFPLLLVSFCPTQKRLPIFRVEIHRNEVRTFMSFMAATGSSPEQSSVRRWQRLGKLECAVARLSWIFKVRRRGCCRLGRVGPEKIFPVSQRGPLGILAYPLIYLPL